LVTNVVEFIDLLLRFWGQCQGRSRQWPENLANTISQKPFTGILPDFGHRCIWVCRCVCTWAWDILVGSKGQGHSRQRHNRGPKLVEFQTLC